MATSLTTLLTTPGVPSGAPRTPIDTRAAASQGGGEQGDAGPPLTAQVTVASVRTTVTWVTSLRPS